ncbi:hypothetical protein HN018_02620 [Lichenicola cladoniae]|uniref:Uncharacterized protein n=1 Tax=Lichenicola cladoniae TaxID=1484109 RepID=A0A6M8HL66_9PROT|nr:hypothetical protein [Lichenicola cladoniae]NPD69274.1 hypothetical protein [Acetobacteraceae bacterium]QKE89091.1 hypothetical protein HN018_02620 [Lichenicola cladoniae]
MRLLGVVVAILAQVALYLALRHLATAYRPAWADLHHPVHVTSLPWPTLVPVDVVHGPTGIPKSPGAPALTAPTLIVPPVIDLPPPALGPPTSTRGPAHSG